jgi:1,2-diacylglycerol 3-beta-glucosyltransferase
VADVTLPWEGLPTVWEVLFIVAFVVIVLMLLWTGALFVRGQRARRRPPEAPPDDADPFTWVFLVPALNEELTIADSVGRLRALELRATHIVAIDDGSDDGTPAALGALAGPGLHVLRREPPDARKGKAAALNYAWRRLPELVAGADADEVIVCVVDADGRLSADAPRYAAASFAADAEVGGVQSLVRIYNRTGPLTWLQDVEFGVYGSLFQAGRTAWGTAGMGGNGQFNRLSALNAIADHDGPWHDRLTEDQDLGLRLIGAGWKGRQELRAVVSQQGLNNVRKLFRQRTRWSQGNLQAMGLLGTVWRAPVGLIPRAEQTAYLLMPFWQGLIGLSLVVAAALAIFDVAPLWDGGPWEELVFFYLLGFGGTMMGCVARGASQGVLGALRGLLIAQVYAFYSWLLWPVLVRSAWRQLTERRDWAKTEREPLDVASP